MSSQLSVQGMAKNLALAPGLLIRAVKLTY